jgi:hypothetical protein
MLHGGLTTQEWKNRILNGSGMEKQNTKRFWNDSGTEKQNTQRFLNINDQVFTQSIFV